MRNVQKGSNFALILAILTIFTTSLLHTTTNAQSCRPSGKLIGKKPPRGKCDPSSADCCKAGKVYNKYTCSPPVSGQTKATLTVNSFEKGGDGGDSSPCDGHFHSDSTRVVALSTGWFNYGSRCGREIIIKGNGRTTRAKVVDECDSRNGCDKAHGYQVPCKRNIVDGSDAVWKALGVSSKDNRYGWMAITWSDA